MSIHRPAGFGNGVMLVEHQVSRLVLELRGIKNDNYLEKRRKRRFFLVMNTSVGGRVFYRLSCVISVGKNVQTHLNLSQSKITKIHLIQWLSSRTLPNKPQFLDSKSAGE